MNGQFIVAQAIRACALGIREAEREDKSPTQYVELLEKLADGLEKGPLKAPVSLELSELDMHRANYRAVQEAGFESPGELLSAYKTLTKDRDAALALIDKLMKKLRPFRPAQMERLYNNSKEITKDVASLVAFKRVVALVEQVHGFRSEKEKL